MVPLNELLTPASIMGIAASLLGLGAASGVVPRAGPLRALVFALQSRFRTAQPASQRLDAVNRLVRLLKTCMEDQYIVVTGPKGVGKTCVVETATQRTPGVVHVRVASGKAQRDIERDVFAAIANICFIPLNPTFSAWFYRLFLPRPIVVLQVSERAEGEPYAQVTGAVRGLAALGLRVIIDSTTDSLCPRATRTERQLVINLEPMTKDTLHSIPELTELFNKLKAVELEHVVWAVLGGVPAAHRRLHARLVGVDDPSKVEALVTAFVQGKLGMAIRRRDEQLAAHPGMEEILEKFKEEPAVSFAELRTTGITLPSPNKVLQVVVQLEGCLLVPANPAMAVVLRHNLTETPSMDKLRLMMNPPKLRS